MPHLWITIEIWLDLWITDCPSCRRPVSAAIVYSVVMAFTFPPAALAWLLDGCGRSVLVLADSLVLPRGLVSQGFQVVAVHEDIAKLREAVGTMGLGVAVARAETLPFEDCCFDAVFVHQIFPELSRLALPEMARVLKPGGRLLISHLGRDDSVPWVRRLAALMRSLDPTAMTSPDVEAALAGVQASDLFQQAQTRDFRHWEPISRDTMIAMVAATPAVSGLDEARRQRFLDEAADIHDKAAGNKDLRLPYELRCWRGVVDPAEPTNPVRKDPPAVVIPL